MDRNLRNNLTKWDLNNLEKSGNLWTQQLERDKWKNIEQVKGIWTIFWSSEIILKGGTGMTRALERENHGHPHLQHITSPCEISKALREILWRMRFLLKIKSSIVQRQLWLWLIEGFQNFRMSKQEELDEWDEMDRQLALERKQREEDGTAHLYEPDPPSSSDSEDEEDRWRYEWDKRQRRRYHLASLEFDEKVKKFVEAGVPKHLAENYLAPERDSERSDIAWERREKWMRWKEEWQAEEKKTIDWNQFKESEYQKKKNFIEFAVENQLLVKWSPNQPMALFRANQILQEDIFLSKAVLLLLSKATDWRETKFNLNNFCWFSNWKSTV